MIRPVRQRLGYRYSIAGRLHPLDFGPPSHHQLSHPSPVLDHAETGNDLQNLQGTIPLAPKHDCRHVEGIPRPQLEPDQARYAQVHQVVMFPYFVGDLALPRKVVGVPVQFPHCRLQHHARPSPANSGTKVRSWPSRASKKPLSAFTTFCPRVHLTGPEH